MKKTIPLNPMPDGTCRTIKNQYFKNSLANFESHGTWGATGVIEWISEVADEKGNRSKPRQEPK